MRRTILGFAGFFLVVGFVGAANPEGYYRQPALHGDTVVFVAEGDLWKVHVDGGIAERLTTHPAAESMPAISPDGSRIAFAARYEGPAELYTMPLAGGMPSRETYGLRPEWIGWTPPATLIYATRAFADLPNVQLVKIEERNGAVVNTRVPLAQAADGNFAEDGTLWFTRLQFQAATPSATAAVPRNRSGVSLPGTRRRRR